jgi:hypothetical protein
MYHLHSFFLHVSTTIDGQSLFQHLGEYGGSGDKTPVWPGLSNKKVALPPRVGETEYSYLNIASLSMPEDPTSDVDE